MPGSIQAAQFATDAWHSSEQWTLMGAEPHGIADRVEEDRRGKYLTQGLLLLPSGITESPARLTTRWGLCCWNKGPVWWWGWGWSWGEPAGSWGVVPLLFRLSLPCFPKDVPLLHSFWGKQLWQQDPPPFSLRSQSSRCSLLRRESSY